MSTSSTARSLRLWFHQYGSEVPDDLFRNARFAWNTLQVIDRPDNLHEIMQRMHAQTLMVFAESAERWRVHPASQQRR